MSSQKEVPVSLGWRVTVPEGSSTTAEPVSGWNCRIRRRLVEFGVGTMAKVSTFGKKVWKMGADDPRKVIHGIKVGVALTLVSLFYYARPLYNGFGSSAMWAVMTVVVVFEYTVGGCLYKAINRAIATLSAGALAVGIDWVATKSGQKVEPLILSASVFLLASAATFSRFIPTVKARFDYGVTIFILTFSLVAVSGYRVDELMDLAIQRVSTIAIGIGITISVCVLFSPVWSGQELHLLISSNMAKLADSLEGCVEDYFVTADHNNTNGEECSSSPRSKAYESVINSKASEDSHANLARWEPAHGRFGFRHPWKQYLKVGSSTRHCAYCVESLHASLNSKTKAPESLKKHLRDACVKLSSDSSKVLRELSSSISMMKRSPSINLFVEEMKLAVQELQIALSSLPDRLLLTQATTQSKDEENKSSGAAALSLLDIVPLMTMASLLIETSSRIEGVVDAVGTLANITCFRSIGIDKSSSKVQDEGQEMKALQEV
ncbi:aluminum-activated malate transporter 10-like [Zingiber officinale]|nr:aluminum-activated malate transporter 10-like [Zingiber officinale]